MGTETITYFLLSCIKVNILGKGVKCRDVRGEKDGKQRRQKQDADNDKANVVPNEHQLEDFKLGYDRKQNTFKAADCFKDCQAWDRWT